MKVLAVLALVLGAVGLTVTPVEAQSTDVQWIASNLTQGINGDFHSHSLSGDGATAVFVSNATNLDPRDSGSPNHTNVILWDRATGSFENLTHGADGDSFVPSVSADGSVVAFMSWATNLPFAERNGDDPDVFLYYRETDRLVNVTVGANDSSTKPQLSADGKFLTFTSYASNLVTNEINGNEPDVFRYDIQNEIYLNISNGPHVFSVDGSSIHAGGRLITFWSSWDQHDPRNTPELIGDMLGFRYVWNADTGTIASLTGIGGVSAATLSKDGNTATFLLESNGGQSLELWDLEQPAKLDMTLPRNAGTNTVLSPDGSTVGVASSDAVRLYVWDRATNTSSVAIERVANRSIRQFSLSEDGAAVLVEVASGDPGLYLSVRTDRPATADLAVSVADLLYASDYDGESAAVLRLYQAFFNRYPDVGGAKYWVQIRKDHSLDAIALAMVQSEEFNNTYAGTTNAQYVSLVYDNVLGRTFDQVGYDYWLDLLDTGTLNRAGIVRWITANSEFIANYPFLPTTTPDGP